MPEIPFSELAQDRSVFEAAGIRSPAPPAEISFADIAPTTGGDTISPDDIADVDTFYRRPKDELFNDDAFDPRAYFTQNPDIAKDPAQLQKLIDVYRARRERGITAGAFKEAVKSAPATGVKFAKGAYKLASNVFEFTGLQPLFNKAASVVTGDAFDAQKSEALDEESSKRATKALAEFQAGTELSATGISDLGRTGARKIFGKAVKDLSDQELLAQLSEDASFQTQLGEVQHGRGESLKAAGLDADTLAKEGIELDPEAIENLSLVDPATIIATGGLFKVVGTGGKVLATAGTRQAAAKAAAALNNAAKVTAGKTVQGTGKVITGAAKAAGAVVGAIPEVAAEATGAAIGLSKGGLGGAYVGAKAAQGAQRGIIKGAEKVARAGEAVSDFGRQVAGEIPRSAGLEKIFGVVGSSPVKGAGAGAAVGTLGAAPLALLTDDDVAAGGILGGGLILGTTAGAVLGTKTAIGEFAAKRQFDPHGQSLPVIDSPAYGIDPALDAVHTAQLRRLSPNEQGAVTTFREAVRGLGGEIYATDAAGFKKAMMDLAVQNKGGPLSPAELAAVDAAATHLGLFDVSLPSPSGGTRRVVFLNSDAAALSHEAGHLFEALLSPDKSAELRDAARQFYTPEQIARFKSNYESRLGSVVTEEFIIAEMVAENFSALFNNVPVTELTAPRGFLTKLGTVLAEGAEALGMDLTGGRVTPDLQAPVSHRLRGLFENAARQVAEANKTAPAAPTAPAPTPTAPAPTPTAPAPTPTAPRNIRVTPGQQNDFAAKRAADTGITEAKTLAASDPAVTARVNEVSALMESGNPVLEIEHLGIKSGGSAAAPEGRSSRRATQETGYAELERLRVENRANAPESVVNTHQKTFVPVRWTNQGGTPTLVAMSLDKVISNTHRIVRESANKNASALIPYPSEQGRLTETGWQQVVSDAQAYAENQHNGFRGDGQRLTRPADDAGLSIPAENPDYTPTVLDPAKADFHNLIQGLATPETAREVKGSVPGNIKGQILAEANKRTTLTPEDIKPKNVGKQEFASFPGRSLKEVNPLRNELVKRGVPVRELIEVTERIRAKDIASVKPRPDINFKAPVTDVIRGGFLPSELPFGEATSRVVSSSPDEFNAMSHGWKGGLTGEAWRIGRGVKSEAEVAVLKQLQEQEAAKGRAAMKSGDFDNAMTPVMKGQFFREAWEAATGEGSAGLGIPREDPSYVPPFPTENTKGKFSGAVPEGEVAGPDASGALPGNELAKPVAPEGSVGKGFQPPEAPRPDNTALFLPAEGVDSPVRYAGEQEGLTPLRFLPGEAPGNKSTPASPSYPDADRLARERGGNAWVRQSPEPDNKNRVLLVQFTPELMYPDGPDPVSTPYYDKLYSGARPGYARGTDFWELPQWVAVAAENLGSKADFYAVRNMAEAKAFLAEADYGRVAFSVMDVSKAVTEELVPHIAGQVDLGGYTDRTGAVAKNPRAKIWNSMNEFIESTGVEYKKGFDYRHFRGTEIIPRLELSAGCRHRCTFCTIDRKVTNSPVGEIDAQVDSFSGLNAKLVYLNDKTFGQSPNIAEMPRLYKEMKAANPEFDGFIVQTTAAQMKTFTDKFLQDSGIKYVELGVETYNDGILKELRKPATEKLIDEAVEKLRRNKINFVPNIVIGFPGETAATYARTMEFLDRNADVVSHVNTYNLAVYEGTEISKKVKTKTAADADENSPNKSFYEDPKIHEDFAKGIYDYGTKRLDSKTAFLPRTDKGRALEETGFVIKPHGQLGVRGVEIFDSERDLIGEIQSVQRGKNLAEVSFVRVRQEEQGQGVGEVLYRELADQLKADGIKTVTGAVVSPGPLAIRKKVFGSFKEIKLNGEPATFEQAIQTAARVVDTASAPRKEVAAIEPVNEITPESQFLPKSDDLSPSELMYQEAEAYFSIGHPPGDAGDPPTKSKVWAWLGGSVKTGSADKTHGIVWGHENTDIVFKGRYDADTDTLSFVAPPNTRVSSPEEIPNSVLSKLRAKFGTRFTLKFFGPDGVQTRDPGAAFLPRVKRNADGMPLKKDGSVDHERFFKERAAQKKRDEAEEDFSKYDLPNNQQELSGVGRTGPTGWILPDKTFVPLATAYHEQYLTENAPELNKKFGTKFVEKRGDFSPNADEGERLAALNRGFVRVRFEANGGILHVEVNADAWRKLKPVVVDHLLDNEGRIDNLNVSLLNNKGQVVDSIRERLFELEGAEKVDKISEAVDSLRASGPRFLPGAQYKPEEIKFAKGWVDPSGKFYTFKKYGLGTHDDFAREYLHQLTPEKSLEDEVNARDGRSASDELYRRGWVRFTPFGSDSAMVNSVDGPALSPKQTRELVEWAAQADGLRSLYFDNAKARPKVLWAGEDAGGPAFLPREQSFKGFEPPTPEELAARRAKQKTAKIKANNPEAILPQYGRDEDGNLSVRPDGKPRAVAIEYDLLNSPLGREAAKGLRGAAREEAVAAALGDKLAAAHKAAIKNPDLEAGSKWYSTARVRLKKLLGDDAKLFAELLGATSARTPVETNFRFALDAYNQFKAGEFDPNLAKYREGKSNWDSGDVADFIKATKNEDPTRGQYLDWWVTKFELSPRQTNGKLYGPNSRAVLRVLDGSWQSEVKGPKTPNFAGNLSGSTFDATVDVWAARGLHRLANEGNPKRWRILPENETGVSNEDFYLGQAAYRHAAEKIGIKPDALQAILWFNEKMHWEKRGWTRGAGAERSDFNTLLSDTERTPEGTLRRKTPQTELDFAVEPGDIKPKRK